jgi:hypothetical protein
MIRGKLHKCPFGLSIPFGCKSAGGCLPDTDTSAVRFMQPISELPDEELDEAIESNLDLLFLVEEPSACTYADKIMKDKKSVDCKYDEDGKQTPVGIDGINGSPNYPHIMIGQMPKAQYSYPKEYNDYYSDDNNTNIYYGIYSLIG